MKQGKVFDKLIARKNVKGIAFNTDHCVVSLTNGSSKKCKTAHEARLFIEGKLDAVAAPTTPAREATVQRLADELLSKQPVVPAAVIAACGTEAPSTIVLDADYVRLCCPEAVIPAGATRVRLRTEQAAILIAAGPAL